MFLVVRLPVPIDVGLGPPMFIQWPACDARLGGTWRTPTQAVAPEQTAGSAERAQNDHREARGMLS
ncbi:hypothetical protein [Reticulibacter mediterranei]|uniref:hypothetical protein n=1 Tax=Reticulibacter mediterranei TaxID=2778369 RepID=UPI001C68A579|nr:hypothetical protein [Reticulibacter mediterranei]